MALPDTLLTMREMGDWLSRQGLIPWVKRLFTGDVFTQISNLLRTSE